MDAHAGVALGIVVMAARRAPVASLADVAEGLGVASGGTLAAGDVAAALAAAAVRWMGGAEPIDVDRVADELRRIDVTTVSV